MKYSIMYKTFLPDIALYELFDQLVEDTHLGTTFYDAEIDSHHAFRDLVRREDVHFWACLADAKPVGMLWITDFQYGKVNVHFATLGNAHIITKMRCGRFAVASVLRLKDENGKYLIEAMHGLTPLRNTLACRFITKVGLVPCGEIPHATWMADTEKLEAALITEATRESAPESWIVEEGK